METDIQTSPPSKKMIWTGRIISTLVVLLLLMDGIMKLMKPQFVVDGTVKLGYQENVIIPLGIVLTACTILYAIPRTSALGAILLTGYLGGAVATHVHAGQGAFPISFPILIGILVWLGLILRDSQLRMRIPLRR
jgi:sorbitol-specific phosphotransferase system component IIC